MATGMNKIYLLGNIGDDPLLTQHGEHHKLRFRLATSRKWKDRDGNLKEETDWHTVVMWGKRTEKLFDLLSRGSRVMVEGRMRSYSYEKDGQTKWGSEVAARELWFAGGNRPDGLARATPPPLDNVSAVTG